MGDIRSFLRSVEARRVWAKENTRNAIWDAIERRECLSATQAIPKSKLNCQCAIDTGETSADHARTNWITSSAPLITRLLVHQNHVARLVWDRKPFSCSAFLVHPLPRGDPMLVLSRKVGEKIVIGDDILVTIEEICGSKVRIGVIAPRNIVVDRHEVHVKRRASPVSTAEQLERIAVMDSFVALGAAIRDRLARS